MLCVDNVKLWQVDAKNGASSSLLSVSRFFAMWLCSSSHQEMGFISLPVTANFGHTICSGQANAPKVMPCLFEPTPLESVQLWPFWLPWEQAWASLGNDETLVKQSREPSWGHPCPANLPLSTWPEMHEWVQMRLEELPAERRLNCQCAELGGTTNAYSFKLFLKILC